MSFSSLNNNMMSLSFLNDGESRSISPENFNAEKGKGGMSSDGCAEKEARELGVGWKVSPYVKIASDSEFTLADIDGSGVIQQIWLTPVGADWRFCILRFYWDDQDNHSVECPVGDFFACGWGQYAQINSLAVCVNPGSALNSYWQMPFRKRCRITITNMDENELLLYYQINYSLCKIPEECSYFHAQFRRVNPLPYKEIYTIVDNIKGQGHYVGTYMCWGVNNNGWWGEGEIKFYIDGDKEFPTICGTGTEDYFCGSYNFENPYTKLYQDYTGPYAGLPQIIRPDPKNDYNCQMRFGMYRWHITDPVRFKNDLKITIQALGWRMEKGERKYLPLQDDISSVAFWYQTLPTVDFPKLPEKDYLEII